LAYCRGTAEVSAAFEDRAASSESIRRDAATGMLLAGSDPRRDGWALAW